MVIESSPVGEAIVRLMHDRLSWKGTASELLNQLEKYTDEATYRSRYFPKAANILKRQLNRLAPDLKALSIYVKEATSVGIKLIQLEKVVKVSTPSTPDSLKPLPHNKKYGVDTFDVIDTIDTSNTSIDTNTNKLFEERDGKYTDIGVDTFSGVDTGVDKKTIIDTVKMTEQQSFQPIGVDSVDKKPIFSKVLDEKNYLQPKGLAKQLFEVGSSCMYTGRNSQLAKQCVGVLVVKEINSAGEIAALTPDGRMTAWIDPAELQLTRSNDSIS